MAEQTKVAIQVGAVAKVLDDHTLILNRGFAHGVATGTRFLIYGLGDEIVDPETKQSLGRLEIVRGIGSAVHVQENMCTVQSAKTRKPSPTVKTIRKDPRSSWGLILGPGEETIEERQGEPTPVPFDNAKVGDYAKSL